MAYNVKKGSRYSEGTEKPLDILPLFLRYIREWLIRNELLFLCAALYFNNTVSDRIYQIITGIQSLINKFKIVQHITHFFCYV